MERQDDPIIGLQIVEGSLQLTVGQRTLEMVDRIDPAVMKADG